MPPASTSRTEDTGQRLLHSGLLVASGLGILGFCVAIDHPEWFHIRPASGTAVAMARASEVGKADGAGAARAAGSPGRGMAAVASE